MAPLETEQKNDIPGVHLVERDVEALGDVLHCLVSLRDDANPLGDGLGRDWVVASDHDHLSAHHRHSITQLDSVAYN